MQSCCYRDGTIQHNGIVHGYHDGAAGHAFKNTFGGCSRISLLPESRARMLRRDRCVPPHAARVVSENGRILTRSPLRSPTRMWITVIALSMLDIVASFAPMQRSIMTKGRAAGLMITHASSLRFGNDIGGELIPGIIRISRLIMNNFEIRPYRHPLPRQRTGANDCRLT